MTRIVFLRLSFASVFAACAAALAPGCDTEEVPVEQRLCERFDGCNYFSAGLDVDDCTDVMTMCTEGLVRSRRDDWAADAEDALGRSNCGNFLETYQQASACTITPDGSVSPGGGTPQGTPNGGGTTEPTPEGCGADVFTCAGPNQIEGCLDGEPFSLSCDVVCGDDPSDGCAHDADAGQDLCFCGAGGGVPDEPEPPGPAPGE